MRLYLLPVSTRRSLLYCQRLNVTTKDRNGLVDKVTSRAAKMWSGWEARESGWQKAVVGWGNTAFRRIPFEEWGLKTVPPLSARRKDDEIRGQTKDEVVYPASLLSTHKIEGLLQRMGTERESLHRKRLIWCIVGMPLTAPFALVPLIPNIPFFYLVYRAWSHWRAISGGKHLQFLVQNKLLSVAPSSILDQIYLESGLPPLPDLQKSLVADSEKTAENKPQDAVDGEVPLVGKGTAKQISEALELPAVELELERAVWQVEEANKAAKAKLASEAPVDEKKNE